MNTACPYHSGIEAKVEAHYKEVDIQITSICAKMEERQKQADLQFNFIKESVRVAKEEMERRLEGMNEFRKQLDSQADTFATKGELKAEEDKINLKLDPLFRAGAVREGSSRWSDYLIMAGISATIVLLTRLLHL